MISVAKKTFELLYTYTKDNVELKPSLEKNFSLRKLSQRSSAFGITTKGNIHVCGKLVEIKDAIHGLS